MNDTTAKTVGAPIPQLEAICKILYEATSILHAAKRACDKGITDNSVECLSGIEAMIEKAGYLNDKILREQFHEAGVAGDYDRWLQIRSHG